MKIACIADLHGELPAPPRDADLIVIAGDVCPDFSRAKDVNIGQQRRWLNSHFRRWIEDLDTEVVAVWGNHDYIGERPHDIPKLPWTLLKDETIETQGLRIHGTPWVPRLPYWAFYGTGETLRRRADLIPRGLDILVSHGPPFGVGDLVPAPRTENRRVKYNQFGDENVGDPTLNAAIAQQKPWLTVCGHIHEARGIYELAGQKVANVAAVDELYRLRDDPWLIVDK